MSTRVQSYASLMERAVVQDFTAAIATEAAQDAERTGQTHMASVMARMARRCRASAERLRAQAHATVP